MKVLVCEWAFWIVRDINGLLVLVNFYLQKQISDVISFLFKCFLIKNQCNLTYMVSFMILKSLGDVKVS